MTETEGKTKTAMTDEPVTDRPTWIEAPAMIPRQDQDWTKTVPTNSPGIMAESPRRTIFQRLNQVMQAVDYVQKTKPAGMRYSIVSHDAVTAKVRPAMVQAGIVYYPLKMQLTQNGNRTEVQMTVRFQNIDDHQEFMDVVTAGYGIDDQDKGPGKAISYAVKYALLKTLGLESGDEPDEDQTTRHTPELQILVKITKERIAAAVRLDTLRAIDTDVRNGFQTGNVTEDLAVELRGLIRQKVEEIKNASRGDAPPPPP